MHKIRKILEENDHERGRKNDAFLKLTFTNILAIGLFTSDNSFCNSFQSDKRSQHCGCKWDIFDFNFKNGLYNLYFVQKMGV